MYIQIKQPDFVELYKTLLYKTLLYKTSIFIYSSVIINIEENVDIMFFIYKYFARDEDGVRMKPA